MSLINDMLRDLSHVQKAERQTIHGHPQAETQVDEQRELLSQSGVNKPNPNVLWPSLLVFVAVMTVLVAWKKNVGNESESVSSTAPQSTISKSYSVVPDNKDNKQDLHIATVVAAPTPQESDVQQQHPATRELNERLAALETAITQLSDRVQESNQVASANVVEATADNESIQTQLVTDDAMDFIEPQESVRIHDPFEQHSTHHAELQSDIAAIGEANDEGPAASELESVAENSHLSIAPNLAFLDQRQAEVARNLVAQGQVMDAVIALQTFIEKNKSPRESAKALLDIYISEKNIPAMEKFLASANYLLPVDHHFYAAKAAIVQEREDYAIELLESQLGNADSDENYRALLAGLYQRKGKYSEAANLYRRLLGNFGEKPAYWLGYALAQDSLNQTQTAKQAYLRVAQYSDLQPQVRSYIEQRLSVLQ